jgi:anti-anti-sigma regulatory factor
MRRAAKARPSPARVTGNQLAARRPARLTSALPGDLPDAAALAGTTASVLCQYDRDRFDPVTLASVAAFHTRSVTTATYHADAVLRICRQYAPPGIRIAGEIDYKAEEPLTLALSEAVRLDGDITVNMAALAFIDAFCARMIADTAKMLADSRTVILQCKPEVATGFARLGLDSLPGVRLVTVREQ